MKFENAINRIKEKELELGHKNGHRFLLCPKSTFSPKTEILFLNLNPGGKSINSEHPDDSCEKGPAYSTEEWKSPLRKQVPGFFDVLSTKIPCNKNLIDDALIAYFIPFRSQNMKDLNKKEESIQFANELWSEIISEIKPKLIICLGNEVCKNVLKILGEDYRKHEEPLNWGKINGVVYFYKDGCRVLKLPHLSTYKIFGKDKYRKPIDKLLTKATENW